MAIQDIQKYIEANKSQYPLEVLLDNLRKSGYPEAEIQGVIRSLNITGVALAPGQGVITAWDKIWRFAVGFAIGAGVSVAAAFGLAIFLFSNYYGSSSRLSGDTARVSTYFSPLIASLLPLILFFLLRRKYPYLAYGILSGLVLVAVALAVVLVFIFTSPRLYL